MIQVTEEWRPASRSAEPGGDVSVFDEKPAGRGQDWEASSSMKVNLWASMLRDLGERNVPRERQRRSRSLWSRRQAEGGVAGGRNVSPREAQAPFGKAVRPIVESSIFVKEGGACYRKDELADSSAGQEGHELIGRAVDLIAVW